MSAVPTVTGGREKAARRIRLNGDPPSPIDLPSGCRFAARCPAAQPICSREAPPLREVVPGHKVSCHFVEVESGQVRAPLDGHLSN
jgi:peptide/nickel transport system ATP-binding protein